MLKLRKHDPPLPTRNDKVVKHRNPNTPTLGSLTLALQALMISETAYYTMGLYQLSSSPELAAILSDQVPDKTHTDAAPTEKEDRPSHLVSMVHQCALFQQ